MQWKTALQSTRVFSVGLALSIAPSLFANHPVLVEGNCNNPWTSRSRVATPGNCGDWDGDGKIGQDEDLDGDLVFGSISAANGSKGVNNNGTITIVSSGTFPESVQISGNVTLEAAPGVSATMDAVMAGDANSGQRQGAVGVHVDAPANRYVVIRNITLRNWASGVMVSGSSHVLLQDVTIEHSANYGVQVMNSAKVMLEGSTISGTGYRLNPGTGDYPGARAPMPGNGVDFADQSTGALINTNITGSFGTGVANHTGDSNAVAGENTTLFDNGQDASGLN